MQEQGGHQIEAGSTLQTQRQAPGPRVGGATEGKGSLNPAAVSTTGEHTAPAQAPWEAAPHGEASRGSGTARQEQRQVGEGRGRKGGQPDDRARAPPRQQRALRAARNAEPSRGSRRGKRPSQRRGQGGCGDGPRTLTRLKRMRSRTRPRQQGRRTRTPCTPASVTSECLK